MGQEGVSGIPTWIIYVTCGMVVFCAWQLSHIEAILREILRELRSLRPRGHAQDAGRGKAEEGRGVSV